MAFGATPVPTDSAALVRLAPRTITDLAALQADLETIRRTGCATAVDELEPGLAAMAAPVRAAGGDVMAALSITGPTLSMGPRRIGELRPILITEARALSRRLGHPEAGDHAA
jgi:DNA-binding IclR family transcriptional regulator